VHEQNENRGASAPPPRQAHARLTASSMRFAHTLKILIFL